MIIIQLIIILICLIGAAFYAGIETGIISIHRMRLEHKHRLGDEVAGKLRDYLDNPDRLLGTTLVGTNICVVIVSVITASIATEKLGAWAEIPTTLLTALIVLVFSEYLPKIWFHTKPQERCGRFVGFLHFSEIIFMPLSKVTIWITSKLMPNLKSSFSTSTAFVTKEDLKILTKEGADDGELSSEEQLMINRVFELSHKSVRQIMIPINKVTFVNDDISLSDFFEVARDTEFTRIPVYNKKEDKFVGIINVFYVLSVPESQHDRKISEFLKAPLFITENMPVDDVLPRLRHYRNPTCLATDTNGKVTGLVALEDILEEIVGEL